MNWISRNSGTIEAVSAFITALVAIAALVGVKYQLEKTEELQRAQSARDSYRSHLALATNKPEFAKPTDVCSLMSGDQSGAYFAFVDHLIYSAEQMLEIEEGWDSTFSEALEPHAQYLCKSFSTDGQTPNMTAFIRSFKEEKCDTYSSCD